MKFSYSIHKYLFLIALIFAVSNLRGQGNPNSVYSRFGLGQLESPGNAMHFGMGGCASAITDGISLNTANPASYSFLDVTNLQIMGKGGFTTAQNNSTNSKYGYGQFHEISMGLKKPKSKWGIAFGIAPYSSIDYTFVSQNTLSDTLTANFTYKGTGGLNKVTLGTSRLFLIDNRPKNTPFKTTILDPFSNAIITIKQDSIGNEISRDTSSYRSHQLSLGVNANYIFGNLSQENLVVFNNSETYTTIATKNLWTNGIIFEAGLIYKTNLTTRRDNQQRIIGGSSIQLGVDYVQNGNLFADYSELISSIRIFNTGALRDTSFQLDSEKGRLTIPQRISAGFAYKIYGKNLGVFMLTGEYRVQDWSTYKLNISAEVNLDKGLKTSSTISAGFEYRPSTDRNSNLLHRMHYRAGFRSYETPLELNDTRILQSGITAGISIPIIKSLSKLHLGAEFGNTGTTANGLVREKYIAIMAGVSLSPSVFDRWFVQTKYD
jgi:hypothetical protein